ncbi:MAG: type VI secretion system contractile sheath small subunit [Deltaproteobacteria bacterium]|jgi:type VI secretion system protein ImpB|nr:type VI secretion system contractile sheath small subunit [Deltaproteobacteria bacterium]
MPKDNSNRPADKVSLLVKPGKDTRDQQELPFKLLILGDFTKSPDPVPVNEREPVTVNSDNLNAVMNSLSPTLEIAVKDSFGDGKEAGERRVRLKFSSFEDFEPRKLAENVDSLKTILDLRKSLLEARKLLAGNPVLAFELGAILGDPAKREKLKKELEGSKT